MQEIRAGSEPVEREFRAHHRTHRVMYARATAKDYSSLSECIGEFKKCLESDSDDNTTESLTLVKVFTSHIPSPMSGVWICEHRANTAIS